MYDVGGYYMYICTGCRSSVLIRPMRSGWTIHSDVLPAEQELAVRPETSVQNYKTA